MTDSANNNGPLKGIELDALCEPFRKAADHAPFPFEPLLDDERAAEFLNFNGNDLVCLQHEFGIFGGEAGGEHVFACHHPIAATRAERLAFHQAGAGGALLAGAALPGGQDLPGGPAQAKARPLHGASAEREVLLQVSRLEKEYTVTSGAVVQRVVGTVKAVSDVSFSLHKGETLGLVGESGCGKTTIGRLVVGLERPSGGAVRFEGEEVSALKGARLRHRRRDLQLMFQDPYSSLDPRMRVGSIVWCCGHSASM